MNVDGCRIGVVVSFASKQLNLSRLSGSGWLPAVMTSDGASSGHVFWFGPTNWETQTEYTNPI